MRILVVNHRDWLNPRAGGVEEVLFQTTTRWVAAGHRVDLLVSDFPGSSTPDRTVEGVRIARRGREELFNWTAPRYVKSSFADADVIVEHIAKVACLLPWHTRQPIVGYVHHLFGRSLFGAIPAAIAAYVVFMEKVATRVYRRCQFIAVSRSTAEDLVLNGVPRGNIHVVHNGVDTGLFQPVSPDGKSPQPSILWVGRVRKTKCVTHVVQAFESIAQRLPGASLTLVGKGDFENELHEMIAHKNLRDRVRLTGFLDPARLREELQRAWVLAYPSPKEGWGLCVIEAAACGTPAVASNVPGLCESVRHGETGFLVPHRDIAALAGKLELVLTDAPLRARLSNDAVAWAHSFSWDKTAAGALEVLQQAASRSR